MKISIVTISYNQSQFLVRCINSVLNQNNIDLEYIIVDPGSTDDSREIIESYGDAVIKVFQNDAGPAEGLNKGFARATGEIFGFINADDYLLPNALSKIERAFESKDCGVFVSGNGYIESSNGERRVIKPTPMTKRNLVYGACTIFQQGTFFTASMFREVNGFNPNNTTCWDYELFVNLVEKGYTNEVIDCLLAGFFVHDGSITGSGRLQEKYREDIERIFLEAVGRQRNMIDQIFSYVLRVQKKCRGLPDKYN